MLLWFLGLLFLCAAGGASFWYRMHIVAAIMRLPMPKYWVREEHNVIIPMRDGIKLVADLYLPKEPGRYPAIITRTPYEKREPDHNMPFLGALFASQGYVCVIQDTRGKHQSEGDFYPFAHEEADGVDTVEWITQQEWSNGTVGMFGSSYLGLTQWLSAPSQGPGLKALVPIFISQRAFDIVRGQHGVLHLKDCLVWHYRNRGREKEKEDSVDWKKVLRKLPVNIADEEAGVRLPCFKDWITHSELDGYWGQWRTDKKVPHIQAPALVIAGWFDRFIDHSIADWQRMRKEGGEVARESRLLIGPWTHEPGEKFPDMRISRTASPWHQLKPIVRWFDRWVKGRDNGLDEEPAVRYYMLGANRWLEEEQWPPKGCEQKRYYLSASGCLNGEPPEGAQEPDSYLYDPMDPVASIGCNAIYAEGESGPRLQDKVEERDDVILYTTKPFSEEFAIAGAVRLHLYASSSAPDTDFTAKICDVDPSGRSISLASGIVRARYRHSLREPSFLTPNEPELFTIEVGNIANLFKKGHRLRLQVSSSAFPEYSRNLNVKEDPHLTTNWQVAHQALYRDQEHPSYLELSVIPWKL